MPLSAATKADLRANGARTANSKTFLKFFFTHPGFHTVWFARCISKLYPAGGARRVLARCLWLYNTRASSCYISPLAKIGPGLELRHPTGIAIGDGAVIGANVSIYQNVTLGQKGSGGKFAYPTLEDNVTVYAGAVLLGDINIGKGATIGANSVVMQSVPANSTAVGIPARILKPAKSKG